MINVSRTIVIIIICMTITSVERAFPFIIFRSGKVPDYIEYLGKVLGFAIMVTLLIYCLRNISFYQLNDFLPQIIALAITIALQLWKGNTMISIVSGTVACMFLTQVVFR